MKLHEMQAIHEDPFFRKMRVEGGFMYNFYDVQSDEYYSQWTFVPDANISDLLPSVEEAGIRAIKIFENDGSDLTTKEVSFFVAGFQECIKWLKTRKS